MHEFDGFILIIQIFFFDENFLFERERERERALPARKASPGSTRLETQRRLAHQFS